MAKPKPRPRTEADNADIARFAALSAEKSQREKQQRQAESKAREEERKRQLEANAEQRRHDDAQAVKEKAARTLKQLRARGAKPAEIAEAEAAYKEALAGLIAVETGTRPEWAPAAETAAGESQDDVEGDSPDGDAAAGDAEPAADSDAGIDPD
ncbi:MAG: hypothetical protein AB7L13_04685 [Acidimicrobiia bacterium]